MGADNKSIPDSLKSLFVESHMGGEGSQMCF